MGKKHFSLEEKATALAWASTGISGSTIAKWMGRSHASVNRLILAKNIGNFLWKLGQNTNGGGSSRPPRLE